MCREEIIIVIKELIKKLEVEITEKEETLKELLFKLETYKEN